MPKTPPISLMAASSLKRLVDIAGAGLGLIVATPILILIMLNIAVRDGPPIFHREQRVGRNGVLFPLLKFRTLHPNTASERSIAPDNDSRITASGRWLRRWRLDELPQLFNVIAGHMSLVGPRPMPPLHVAELPESIRRELFAVRPGLTSPAAIHFLAEDTALAAYTEAESLYLEKILPVKAAMHVEYVRNWSLAGDFGVMFRTLISLWSPAQRRLSLQNINRLLGGS